MRVPEACGVPLGAPRRRLVPPRLWPLRRARNLRDRAKNADGRDAPTNSRTAPCRWPSRGARYRSSELGEDHREIRRPHGGPVATRSSYALLVLPTPDQARKRAVLAIDLQRDFLEDEGRIPVARSQVEALIAAANSVTASAAAHGVKVVYVGNEFPRSQWLANLFRRNAALTGSRGGESTLGSSGCRARMCPRRRETPSVIQRSERSCARLA